MGLVMGRIWEFFYFIFVFLIFFLGCYSYAFFEVFYLRLLVVVSYFFFGGGFLYMDVFLYFFPSFSFDLTLYISSPYHL